jgi:small-conductance mechanosensitive channel
VEHAPPPAPPASAAPAPVRKDGTVLLGDDKVFLIRAPRAGKTPEQRAQGASAALTAVSERVTEDDVRVDRRGDVAIVIVGQTPIIQLTLDDAQAAGDASLDVHAASVASALRSAIERDHRKRALSHTVFSISLLVFLGLIAFYLMKKIGEFGERARLWIDTHAETALAIRVQQIEVVSPGTVRSTALVGLSVGRWLAQLGVFYAWLVVGLSLFEATRDYTGKLTGLIVSPLSQLMTRLATGLPVLAVLVLAGFVVFVLVRFIGLFFDSIERRENVVSWIAPDLAAPTGALLRVAVVLGALVYLVPLVTGSTEGTLGRTGAVALVALGLACTPLLASGVLGVIVLFGRRLRAGLHVEIGSHTGRISSIGLLDLRLEDADRAEVRIPHLYSLRHPLRVLGVRPRFGVDIPVAAGDRHADVQSLLLGVASRLGDDARVELVSADAERTLFRVTLASEQRNARSELQLAIVEALSHAGVPLGKLGAPGAAS